MAGAGTADLSSEFVSAGCSPAPGAADWGPDGSLAYGADEHGPLALFHSFVRARVCMRVRAGGRGRAAATNGLASTRASCAADDNPLAAACCGFLDRLTRRSRGSSSSVVICRPLREPGAGTAENEFAVPSTLPKHTARVNAVRWITAASPPEINPAEVSLVSGSSDHTAVVWSRSAADGGWAPEVTLSGHTDAVTCVDAVGLTGFGPIRRLVATAAADRTVRVSVHDHHITPHHTTPHHTTHTQTHAHTTHVRTHRADARWGSRSPRTHLHAGVHVHEAAECTMHIHEFLNGAIHNIYTYIHITPNRQ